jgi:hypothetical protein
METDNQLPGSIEDPKILMANGTLAVFTFLSTIFNTSSFKSDVFIKISLSFDSLIFVQIL